MTIHRARLAAALAVLYLVTFLVAGCGDGSSTADNRAEPSTDAPSTSAPSADATPATPSTSPVPSPTKSVARRLTRYVFPVVGRADYHRTHSIYPATDIFADCGSRVRSPVDGVVLEVGRVDRFVKSHPLGADKGGRFVSVRGDDGVRYYGAHLTKVTPGLAAGQRIAAGAPWGTVGRTGNANDVCHLHFALSPPCAGRGDWWIRRGVVYPWSYLDAWRQGTATSPAPAIAAWLNNHGCGKAGLPGV